MQGDGRTAAQEVRQQLTSEISNKQQWVTPSFERVRLNEALEDGGLGIGGFKSMDIES